MKERVKEIKTKSCQFYLAKVFQTSMNKEPKNDHNSDDSRNSPSRGVS